MKENQRVLVSILDKDYQVACKPNERDALNNAAQELDQRMRKIRNSGANIGLERIAVMAALNLCHELQQAVNGTSSAVDSSTLSRINEKLDESLED